MPRAPGSIKATFAALMLHVRIVDETDIGIDDGTDIGIEDGT